ncbi:hypothetical protein RKD23_005465 [Streptomyces sp. SAI-170]|uniref:hypothetical protein n=1 Tax=Streptomyces sp. SAI-170 TaxID=3377729 RepID=UPI003C7AC754
MNTERSDNPDRDDAVAGEAGTSAEERPGRRRPPVVASVAAAVLLVAGGGAYLAASVTGGSGDSGRASSGAPGDDGTPPPLALDGYSEGGGAGIAPGEPDPNGAVYRAGGTLPDGPDSAPVYRAKGEVTQDDVARLAAALDIAGTPVLQGQSWRVGARDDSGPTLQVNRQAPGTWTFHRYAPGTDNCKPNATECPHRGPMAPAADPVSEDAAKKAAAPVLKAVGQDDAKVDASQVMGAQRLVNADPEIGGLPTYGWATGLTVGVDGEIVGGNGQLEAPVKGDTYPVLGARETLERMNAGSVRAGSGVGGCASPEPLEESGQIAPCEPEPLDKQTIEVRGAVFGLASHVVDGRQALVPSWLFEVRAPGTEDTFTVTHPAVEPRYLASPAPGNPPPGEPTAPPSPRPTGPGPDEPTSAPSPRDVRVEAYEAEGRELTVRFTGGVCADYTVAAAESADRVTVTVTEKPWPGKMCILIAKVFHRTVQLEEPLGDRRVVGSNDRSVPLEKPGARLPEASTAR